MDAMPQRNTSNWLIYESFFCSILVLILLLTGNTFIFSYQLISANHCGVNCGPSVVGSEKSLVWFPLAVGLGDTFMYHHQGFKFYLEHK